MIGRSDSQDHLGGLFDHLRVTLGVGPVAGKRRQDVLVARPVPVHLVGQRILRDVDQRRAGPTGRGDVERLADRHRDLVGRHHQLVVLRARPGDPHRVALLERIGADRSGRHLAGDRDHRNRVHVRIHQRCDQVRRRRAGGDHGDAGLARHVGVPLGGMAGALLMAHRAHGGSTSRAARSYAGRMQPPGYPNMSSTPSISSERMSACAPVIRSTGGPAIRSTGGSVTRSTGPSVFPVGGLLLAVSAMMLPQFLSGVSERAVQVWSIRSGIGGEVVPKKQTTSRLGGRTHADMWMRVST